MKIVCISDTHTFHRDLDVPDGDVLIHSGDVSFNGEPYAYKDFDKWLGELPHKKKIIIAGNHDFNFYEFPWLNGIPLNNSGIRFDGVSFYGSPITPTFSDWAFMADPGDPIKEYWDKIPKNTDVLIVHGPPLGILDETDRHQNVGCYDLLQAVKKIKPKLNVFGHIHQSYGKFEADGTIFVNASSCNEQYDPVNAPIVVEISAEASRVEKERGL